MNRMKLVAVALVLVFAVLPTKSPAAIDWYFGDVQRIYMFNGGFVLRMSTTALDDCLHKYVYFREVTLPEKTVDRAYSMALSAQASGKQLGVVIDKAINGPGGMCESTGDVDIR